MDGPEGGILRLAPDGASWRRNGRPWTPPRPFFLTCFFSPRRAFRSLISRAPGFFSESLNETSLGVADYRGRILVSIAQAFQDHGPGQPSTTTLPSGLNRYPHLGAGGAKLQPGHGGL